MFCKSGIAPESHSEYWALISACSILPIGLGFACPMDCSMDCRPWKIVVDLFFTITFIFLRKTKNKTTGTAWHVMSFPWSNYSQRPSLLTNQRARIRSVFAAVVGKWYHFVQMINAIPQWNFQYRALLSICQTVNRPVCPCATLCLHFLLGDSPPITYSLWLADLLPRQELSSDNLFTRLSLWQSPSICDT